MNTNHHIAEILSQKVKRDEAVLAAGVEDDALVRLLTNEADSVMCLFEFVHDFFIFFLT
jgi:hypothetical protein